MEIRQLSYFLKAAETQNFTEAANELYITQSTLSQQIKQLEDELNIMLFDRIGKKVFLTEAGHEFIPFVKNTLKDIDLAKQKILDLQKVRGGKLKIGITYSLSFRISNMILKFRKLYPEVKIEILYGNILELAKLLQQREIDFLLSFSLNANTDYVDIYELFDVPPCVIASKNNPIANKDTISLKELKNYSLVLPSKGLSARTYLDNALKKLDLELEPLVEMNDAHMILQLVESSLFITILAQTTIYDKPELKPIKIEENDKDLKACLLSLKGSYSKAAAKAFVKILLEDLKISFYNYE